MQSIAVDNTDTNAPLEGKFSIIGRNRKGEIVLEYADNNMIVNSAKTTLARLISDAGQDSKVVTQIGVGTDGNGPTPDDTSLTGSFVKLIDGYTYPTTGQVTFQWSLGYGEANGMEIREFALISSDNTLFARKTRGVITKDDDLSLQGEWTIIF